MLTNEVKADIIMRCMRIAEEKAKVWPDDQEIIADGIHLAEVEVPMILEELDKYKKFEEFIRGLYGHNYQLKNYHLNGADEPFDNLYEAACETAQLK